MTRRSFLASLPAASLIAAPKIKITDLRWLVDAAGDQQDAVAGAPRRAHQFKRIGFGGPVSEQVDAGAAHGMKPAAIVFDLVWRARELCWMFERATRKWQVANRAASEDVEHLLDLRPTE